jgi:hypothetical protein
VCERKAETVHDVTQVTGTEAPSIKQVPSTFVFRECSPLIRSPATDDYTSAPLDVYLSQVWCSIHAVPPLTKLYNRATKGRVPGQVCSSILALPVRSNLRPYNIRLRLQYTRDRARAPPSLLCKTGVDVARAMPWLVFSKEDTQLVMPSYDPKLRCAHSLDVKATFSWYPA